MINSLRSISDVLRRDIKRSLQLAFVKIARQQFINEPNFICIGAPKAATTWLHNRLNKHPDIFLPKDKELHFFDEPFEHEKKSKKSSQIFFGKHKYYNLTSASHWRWYKFQFEKSNGKVNGDITPTYARISKDRISVIHNNLPDVKIIYIIRNPIERAWSGASYFMHRWYGKSMQGMDDEESLLQWVMDEERLDHGRYVNKIKNWESVYSKDQIKYIFYDDICTQPDQVLEEVCKFIGVDSLGLGDRKQNSKKINTSYPKFNVPDYIHEALLKYYEHEIDYLSHQFNRDLSGWKVFA